MKQYEADTEKRVYNCMKRASLRSYTNLKNKSRKSYNCPLLILTYLSEVKPVLWLAIFNYFRNAQKTF